MGGYRCVGLGVQGLLCVCNRVCACVHVRNHAGYLTLLDAHPSTLTVSPSSESVKTEAWRSC
jgi:hypothetical protein